jgi:hypothetical protein
MNLLCTNGRGAIAVVLLIFNILLNDGWIRSECIDTCLINLLLLGFATKSLSQIAVKLRS